MRSLIVIPARLASTRLPRKMLLVETGQPLIQHTYEAARQSRLAAHVIVATSDPEVYRAVIDFGGAVRMTGPATCGTDRVAQVAAALAEVECVVNVQGDQPEITGEAIDLAIRTLAADPQAAVATLAAPLRDRGRIEDPACVRIVVDGAGYALYFSRAAIPAPRVWSDAILSAEPPVFWEHVGVYAFRRDALLRLAAMPEGRLERLEGLEQLRWLEAGHTIAVAPIAAAPAAVDTPADYARFVASFRAKC